MSDVLGRYEPEITAAIEGLYHSGIGGTNRIILISRGDSDPKNEYGTALRNACANVEARLGQDRDDVSTALRNLIKDKIGEYGDQDPIHARREEFRSSMQPFADNPDNAAAIKDLVDRLADQTPENHRLSLQIHWALLNGISVEELKRVVDEKFPAE